MKKVVIIDNYDSFTYNLVHLVWDVLGIKVDVYKNDQFELSQIEKYEYVILSPGPGIPDEAGLLKEVIQTYGTTKKILGVCLGLQAIGEVHGYTLKNLEKVFHGIRSQVNKIRHTNDPILNGVPDSFYAGRYHSWVIDQNSKSDELIISSLSEDGEIMSAYHRTNKIFGVQFHPESIMTNEGSIMLSNFLNVQ